MLAVLSGLLKRGAGAMGGDALSAEADRHFVRIRVRAFDSTVSARIVEVDLVHYFPFLVIQPAEKGAGAEQATEASIGERGECVS
jgi:hypothetical protein